MIFDTETTSIEKPFCYNIGYVIVNADTYDVVMERDFVCEQVWHNPMLFTTAYYSDKKDMYISRMRQRQIKMEKFGYICQQMIRDIKAFEITQAYAYNSNFDERVFNFNCEWFKCNNPFDNVKILDIRGYFHNVIDDNYKEWCERNEKFTESGHYSSTAESVYQFLTNDLDFEEEHTALADSEIETSILFYCVNKGCELGTDYKAKRSIPRKVNKNFVVKKNGEIVFESECNGITYRKKNDTVLLYE